MLDDDRFLSVLRWCFIGLMTSGALATIAFATAALLAALNCR